MDIKQMTAVLVAVGTIGGLAFTGLDQDGRPAIRLR